MTTLNDFTICCTVKKVCFAFLLVHISFSKNLDFPAYAEF